MCRVRIFFLLWVGRADARAAEEMVEFSSGVRGMCLNLEAGACSPRPCLFSRLTARRQRRYHHLR